jgi:hypothetical protein
MVDSLGSHFVRVQQPFAIALCLARERLELQIDVGVLYRLPQEGKYRNFVTAVGVVSSGKLLPVKDSQKL